MNFDVTTVAHPVIDGRPVVVREYTRETHDTVYIFAVIFTSPDDGLLTESQFADAMAMVYGDPSVVMMALSSYVLEKKKELVFGAIGARPGASVREVGDALGKLD